MEDWHVPSHPGALPAAQRVLVFAPHPDDEVFGCGGVIALYAAQGVAVKVVVVSDGSAQVEPALRAGHAEVRAEESRAALASLGISDVVFWSLPDRSLSCDDELLRRVAGQLCDTSPDVVLAPSLWEIHPDHLAVGSAVWQVMSEGVSVPACLLMYEVGGAQRVNLLVDITTVWPAKSRAIDCFVSQQQRQDYARHIEALNAWRTYTLPSEVRYAEGLTMIDARVLRSFNAALPDVERSFMRWAADELLLKAELSVETMRQQLAAKDRAIAQHEATVAALQAQLVQSEAQLVQSEAARAMDQDAVTQLEAANRELQRHLQAMHGSTSWRVTAPLRWLSARLRGR